MELFRGKVIQIATSEAASGDRHTGTLTALTEDGCIYVAFMDNALLNKGQAKWVKVDLVIEEKQNDEEVG